MSTSSSVPPPPAHPSPNPQGSVPPPPAKSKKGPPPIRPPELSSPVPPPPKKLSEPVDVPEQPHPPPPPPKLQTASGQTAPPGPPPPRSPSLSVCGDQPVVKPGPPPRKTPVVDESEPQLEELQTPPPPKKGPPPRQTTGPPPITPSNPPPPADLHPDHSHSEHFPQPPPPPPPPKGKVSEVIPQPLTPLSLDFDDVDSQQASPRTAISAQAPVTPTKPGPPPRKPTQQPPSPSNQSQDLTRPQSHSFTPVPLAHITVDEKDDPQPMSRTQSGSIHNLRERKASLSLTNYTPHRSLPQPLHTSSSGQLPIIVLGSGPLTPALTGQTPLLVPSLSTSQLGSSEVTPPVNETKEEKQARHRRKVIMEILETEKFYCTSLSALVGVASPILETILTPDEHKLLFSNIETLLNCNGNFSYELDGRVRTLSDDTCIGDIFLKFTPYLKLYSQYVSNHDAASKFDKELSQQKRFLDIRSQIFGNPRLVNAPNLAFYFIMPIQRIPRYSLLLGEMIKCTPEAHPDYQDLKRALEQVNSVAHHVNTSIAQQQQRHQVYEMAELMGLKQSEFVQPQRRFVKRGQVFKVCFTKDKLYEFFLFNDILIYCSGGPTKYKVHLQIPIDHKFFIEDLEDDLKRSNQFKIINGIKTFIAYCHTTREKQEWTTVMSELSEIGQAKIRKDGAPSTPRSRSASNLQPGTPGLRSQRSESNFFSVSRLPPQSPPPPTFDHSCDLNLYRPTPLKYRAIEAFDDTSDPNYIQYPLGANLNVLCTSGQWWIAQNLETAKMGLCDSTTLAECRSATTETILQANTPLYSAIALRDVPSCPQPTAPKQAIRYMMGDLVIVMHELNDWALVCHVERNEMGWLKRSEILNLQADTEDLPQDIIDTGSSAPQVE